MRDAVVQRQFKHTNQWNEMQRTTLGRDGRAALINKTFPRWDAGDCNKVFDTFTGKEWLSYHYMWARQADY